MKNIINKMAVGCLSVFMVLFLVSSCNSDDEAAGGNFDIVSLEMMLAEARDILNNTEEGVMAGNQKPGSKAILQSVIAWIEKRITTSKSQEDIDDAGLKLEAAIQNYRDSVVSARFLYVQQEDETYISISENVRPIIASQFSIQGEFYMLSLTICLH